MISNGAGAASVITDSADSADSQTVCLSVCLTKTIKLLMESMSAADGRSPLKEQEEGRNRGPYHLK